VQFNSRFNSLEEIYAAYGGKDFQVDLGCGFNKPFGYIGIDNGIGKNVQIPNEEHAPDIVIDLNNDEFPFPDNSCAIVRSSHFLEHSSNLDHVLDESYRVLKPGGKFVFIVPYANSAEGMFPGHNVFFTEVWFHDNVNFNKRFKIKKEIFYPGRYFKRSPLRLIIPFFMARKFLFNACWQMEFHCEVRK